MQASYQAEEISQAARLLSIHRKVVLNSMSYGTSTDFAAVLAAARQTRESESSKEPAKAPRYNKYGERVRAASKPAAPQWGVFQMNQGVMEDHPCFKGTEAECREYAACERASRWGDMAWFVQRL